MTITLEASTEAVIQRKIADALYSDADVVIREALRLLEEHDRLMVLRAKLAVAEEQADRGDGRPLTPGLWEEIQRNTLLKAAAGRRPNPMAFPKATNILTPEAKAALSGPSGKCVVA
jgi:putative addiction module CopG family antidote